MSQIENNSNINTNSQTDKDNTMELVDAPELDNFKKNISSLDPFLQTIINNSKDTPDAISSILKALTLLREQEITIEEALSTITKYTPTSIHQTSALNYLMGLKNIDTSLFDQIRLHLEHSDSYENFIGLINLYNQTKLTSSELIDSAYQYIGNDKNLWSQFLRFVDAPKVKACLNPSYSTINKKYICSAPFDALQSEFNVREKNPSEEILFDIEDHRYKLALLTQLTEKLVCDLEQSPVKLHAVYNNIFTEIFEDDYEDVVSGVKHSPELFVKPVLQRVKIQLKKWKSDRRRWERIWKYQERLHVFKSKDYLTVQNKRLYTKSLTHTALANQLYSICIDNDSRNFRPALPSNSIHGYTICNQLPENIKQNLHEDIGALLFHTIQKDHNLKVTTKTQICSLYQSLVQKFFKVDPFSLVEHDGSIPEYALEHGSQASFSDDEAQKDYIVEPPVIVGDVLILNFFQIYDSITQYLAQFKSDLDRNTYDHLQVSLSVTDAYYHCIDALKQRRSNKINQNEFEDLIRPTARLNVHSLIKVDEAIASLVRQLIKVYNTSQSINLLELFISLPSQPTWNNLAHYFSLIEAQTAENYMITPSSDFYNTQFCSFLEDSIEIFKEHTNSKLKEPNTTNQNGFAAM
jgi:histone deacetylase complex regulatory component SIN3